MLHAWLLSNLTQVTINTRKKASAGVRFEPGPALSRLNRLLPIGPRDKGGPALRLLTYTKLHFLLKLLM